MELWDLTIRVERIEGRSVCGMEVGDCAVLRDSSKLEIPAGRHFCIYASPPCSPCSPPSSATFLPTTGSSRTRSSPAPIPTSD